MRTIKTLFSVFSCLDCQKRRTDEFLFINETKVYLYFLNPCQEFSLSMTENLILNKRAKALLEFILYSSSDDLIIWLEDINIFFENLEITLLEYKKIHILIDD